ncbi:MAG TPA: PstS family phosphate ABC transporter substrate-binding protein [Holophagaceae bacterium]|nr:PstS family phosphate ABC transporter substrate-binding protein [Holophagaceae bacterium]
MRVCSVLVLGLFLGCQPVSIEPGKAVVEAAAPRSEPPGPQPYVAERAVEGPVRCVGSDSMEPLMMLWALDFKARHPKSDLELRCKGSATAPKALLAGETLLGHMSREMTSEELAAFRAKFGYDPLRIVVAADALAVYVNANNPISRLSLPEVDALFGQQRKGGHPMAVAAWGDLGLSGEWKGREVHPYGRDENSGTRAFFREHVLRKGEFKEEVKAMADQFAILEALATDAGGVGYGPIQHRIGQVRQVPLVDFGGSEAIPPTPANILSGRYPLYRFLYIYVNKAPGKPLDPGTSEFLRFILSKEGQAEVVAFGALPLPADLLRLNQVRLR